MDEPGWSWPAWKFGMKREDLFTKLHDQYNTVPSSIQDPEAFHHDVYEISSTAHTCDEFHRLLAERRQQRLSELENGLESASMEIIANPKLVGTTQWQHALQLFRTRSLDSLVRYFSSYLPDDHPWRHSDSSASTTAATSFECGSETTKPFFDAYDDDEKPILTQEPLSISTNIPTHHLPPSPRSLTMSSNSTSPTDMVDRDYAMSTLTPARTLSFSEPESESLVFSTTLPPHHVTNDGRFDRVDTPTTSVSDASEVRSLPEEDDFEDIPETQVNDELDDAHDTLITLKRFEIPSTDSSDRKAHGENAGRAETKITGETPALYTQAVHEYVKTSSRRSHDGSPRGVSRKSPGLSQSRIQKPLPDPIRSRPSGRRRPGL